MVHKILLCVLWHLIKIYVFVRFHFASPGARTQQGFLAGELEKVTGGIQTQFFLQVQYFVLLFARELDMIGVNVSVTCRSFVFHENNLIWSTGCSLTLKVKFK